MANGLIVEGFPTRGRTKRKPEISFAMGLCVTVLCCMSLLLPFTAAHIIKRNDNNKPAVIEKPVDDATKSPINHVCNDPGCHRAATWILDNMDQSVDPCEDFYRFSCGNFIKKSVIPDYKSSVNVFGNIDDKLQEQLRITIESQIHDSDIRPFKLLQSYYNACMNETQIELTSEKELMDFINKLGGWPVLQGDTWDDGAWDWLDVSKKLLQIGFSTDSIITTAIDVDLKNNTNRMLSLDQASTELPQEYLSLGLDDKLVQGYYKLMVDLAEYFGAERAQAKRELFDAVQFEISLAKISLPQEKRRDANEQYNPMTIAELSKTYRHLPWLEHLNALLEPHHQLTEDEVVLVIVPSFFEELEKLLQTTPKRTLANYLMWRVVSESAHQLGEKVRELLREFEATMYGTSTKLPRWKECVKKVTDGLNLASSALYVRSYFDESAKQSALFIIENITKSFKSILEKISWMDETTRASALEKVDNIIPHIAYPDELRDNAKLEKFYEKLELVPDSYLRSRLNIKTFSVNYALEEFRKPVNQSDWETHGYSAIVNAFYNPTENSIQFPAGILQGAFFDNERPRYLNYGGIGFVMGHEITHGFDDQGRQFDKVGNLVDWWQPETKERYLKRAQCIINQYSNYTVREIALNINGINTQGENIADNGGIKEAYLAYNEWEKENGIEPGLPNLPYTSQQLFWIEAANIWCQKMRPEALKVNVITDVHSPGEFRVRGPFSNMPEFAKDFNCPLGSPMNPENKCSVW